MTAPPAESSPRSFPRGVLLLLLVALAACFAWNVQRYYFLGDDCFISFRYSRNLVEGHGPVYNPGERVEGYTNFSWVLLMAACLQVGIPAEIASNVLGIASGALLVLLLLRTLRQRMAPRSPVPWVIVGCLVLSRSFTAWCTSGLETMFYALLLFVGFESYLREREQPGRWPTSALWLGLATLTRPDGALFAFAAGLFFLLDLAARRRTLGAGIRWATPYVVLVLGHALWRRGYYGEWLPNTFRAKVNGVWWEQGVRYLAQFHQDYRIAWFLPLILLAFLRPAHRSPRHRARGLYLTALVLYLTYVASVGGDRFEFRFLVVVFPWFYILLGEGLEGLYQAPRWRPALRSLALGAAVGLLGLTAAAGGIQPIETRDGVATLSLIKNYADGRIEQGKFLRDKIEAGVLPRELTLAVGGAGAVPYYTGWKTIDRKGLNDATVARQDVTERKTVAHEKSASYEYLVEREVAILASENRLLFADDQGVREGRPRTFQGHELEMRAIWLDPWYLVFATCIPDESLRGLLPGVEILRPETGRRPAPRGGARRGEPGGKGSGPAGDDDDESARLRFRRVHDAMSPAQQEELEQLRAIGYVAGESVAPDRKGVTRHDPSRAAPGLNFYMSGHAPEAFLVDAKGQVLHRWGSTYAQAFPDRPEEAEAEQAQFWRRAFLLPEGDLLAIFEGLGLVRLDRDSRIRWSLPNAAHHDLDLAEDGKILVLTRKAHVVPRIHPRRPILEDFLSVHSPDGELLREVSLLECFERSDYFDLCTKKTHDIFHTNTLEILRGTGTDERGPFRPGHVLISLRAVDVIAVVDLPAERVVWAHRGTFRSQHDPHLLPGGNLLLFDNLGLGTASRILELEPASGSTVWSYTGTEEDPFFSNSCGTAQRLPTGTTLITETTAGRAFEVTPEGEVVWEFFSPHRAGEQEEFIAMLFDLQRVPADRVRGWLPGLEEATGR